MASLPQQRVHKQTAAHADPAVDPPHRELDPGRFQSLAPGQHMLVDAVHQRAVEIKEKRTIPGYGHRNSPNCVYLVYLVYLVFLVYRLH